MDDNHQHDAQETEAPDGWGSVRAQDFPVETYVKQAGMMFNQDPDGGMTMKLIPMQAVQTPVGPQQVPFGTPIAIRFDPDGWRRFKQQVADDGVQPPQVVVAGAGAVPGIHLPNGARG